MGRSLRIALLSYRSKPHSGGQGLCVRALPRELAALGHRVEVLSGQPYPELDDGIALTEVPSLDLYREPDPFGTPPPRGFRDWVDPAGRGGRRRGGGDVHRRLPRAADLPPAGGPAPAAPPRRVRRRPRQPVAGVR